MSASNKGHVFGSHKLFGEVKWEVMKVHFLLQLLNAAILFFALNIILTIFNMSYLYSAAISIVYLIYSLSRGWKKSVLRKLEEGNPEVNELLRTAYEHRSEETLMVQGLMYDLQHKLSTVSAGVLINPRDLTIKLVSVAILAFTPVMIVSFTPFLLQQNPLEDFNTGIFQGDESIFLEQILGIKLNSSDEMYGDSSLIDLGNDKLNLELAVGGGTVQFNNVKNPEKKDFRYNEYPIEAVAEDSESYQGVDYSDSDVNLINEYSCVTKGTC